MNHRIVSAIVEAEILVYSANAATMKSLSACHRIKEFAVIYRKLKVNSYDPVPVGYLSFLCVWKMHNNQHTINCVEQAFPNP